MTREQFWSHYDCGDIDNCDDILPEEIVAEYYAAMTEVEQELDIQL